MTTAEAIATEHCRWARWEARLSPVEVVASVHMPVNGVVTWDAAIEAVMHAYTAMHWRYKAAA